MPDSEEEKGKWSLSIGCHKKTRISRDSENRTHNSLEECRRDVKESEKCWARIGYYVWFARATGPDGEVVELHEGTPYY